MRDLIVSVLDHCLPFFLYIVLNYFCRFISSLFFGGGLGDLSASYPIQELLLLTFSPVTVCFLLVLDSMSCCSNTFLVNCPVTGHSIVGRTHWRSLKRFLLQS